MKTLELTICRKEYSVVLVAVPDDFDEARLMHADLGPFITEAVDDSSAADDLLWDDDPMDGYEVESVEPCEFVGIAEDGSVEDDDVVDLTVAIAAYDRQAADWRAKAEGAGKHSPRDIAILGGDPSE